MCRCCRLSELNLGWTELSGAALCKLAAAAPTSLTKLNLSGCKDELKDSRKSMASINAMILEKCSEFRCLPIFVNKI